MTQESKPIVYFIANGIIQRSMSGGAKNFIETAGQFKQHGFPVRIITNPVGRDVCISQGLDDVEYILTDEDSRSIENPYKILYWYIKRGILSAKIVRSIVKKPEDRVFLFDSDFYCNTLSLLYLKDERAILLFNMVAPNPFWGYTQKFHIPRLNEIHYLLNNYITFLIIYLFCNKKKLKITAGAQNIKNDLLKKSLLKRFPILIAPFSIHFPENFEVEKKYDFVWIGRNHPQKGIDDLENILLEIKKLKPDFTINIIGDVKDRLQKFAVDHDLQGNINIAGVIYGDEKFTQLGYGKVLLFTSHFESYGLVILESMIVKNHIVGYDIPTSKVNFEGKMTFVKKFDWQEFAKQALSELGKYPDGKLLSSNRKYAESFSWENLFNIYITLLNEFKTT